MPQQPMYPAQVNSNITELAEGITDSQDTIELVVDVLPAAPNLAVIGNGENAETILYTAKSGNTLTGVTRGFQGVAQAWGAGSRVGRFFTAYDHDSFKANIEEIDLRVTVTEANLGNANTQIATIQRGIQAILTSQATPVWMKKILGRTIVNHAPVFDSGLWTFHANVTVNSPTKITLNATASYQHSSIIIDVKANTDYFLDFKVNRTVEIGVYGVSSTAWILSLSSFNAGFTFNTGSNTRIEIYLSNSPTGIFTFENIMLNEGTAAQEFVAGMQSLDNVVVKRYGKNLLPPFSEWTLHANAKMLEPYKLEFERTGSNQFSTCEISALPSTQYFVSITANPTSNIHVGFRFYDLNGVELGMDIYSVVPRSFTTPIGTVKIKAELGTAVNGVYTFETPMLSLEDTKFEPQNNDFIVIPFNGRSLPDGSNPDVLTERDGKYVALRRHKQVVLDATLDWTFGADAAGWKYVSTPISNAVHYQGIAIKYDGKVLSNVPSTGSFSKADEFQIPNNNRFYISIADTDSGWGETYTPTADEIKAYFMGWTMCQADGNKYTSGTKYWYAMYSGTGNSATLPSGAVVNEGASSVSTLPTTFNSNGYKPYKLQYQLATPYEEEIGDAQGLSLFDGTNQVELLEGVYRERANPVLSGGTYQINRSTLPTSKLANRTAKILKIYNDGMDDTDKWSVISSSTANGDEYASISEADFDPTAVYEVVYEALDKYKLTTNAVSAEIVYETSLKSVVDRVVQDLADARQTIADLERSKANREQMPWITAVLLNGWINYGGSYSTAEFYKDEMEEVEFKASIKHGTITDGTVLCYLPKGFRPKEHRTFLCINNNSTTIYPIRVRIQTDGAIVLYGVQNNVALDINFKFRAEQ